MAEEIILKAVSISKSFGGVKALQDVSFELKKGEVLSVIGENGAGKSTLMKIIAGALKNDKGDIYFQGEKLSLHFSSGCSEKGHLYRLSGTEYFCRYVGSGKYFHGK